MPSSRLFRLALIINPYAGIGGEAGLKGSDHALEQALAYSDRLRTPERAKRFLQALGDTVASIEFITGSGLMGQDVLVEQGITPHFVFAIDNAPSTAADTRLLAAKLVEQQPDLLVFVGGDGTARDIVDSVGLQLPCLGLPGGVKMQSGVFALSPEAGAQVVLQLLAGEILRIAEQDVRDIDEQALRQGQVRSRYYGSLQVPASAQWIQNVKQGSVEDETLLRDEIADTLIEIMEENRLMLIGPGSTTAFFMQKIACKNTLVGFDAIKNGQLIASDLNARDISELLDRYPDAYIVVSPTGAQGFLLGRGNQQLNPEVLRKIDKSQWVIVASQNKLQQLEGRPLLIDTNDQTLDEKMAGLYPVLTSWQHKVLYKVGLF